MKVDSEALSKLLKSAAVKTVIEVIEAEYIETIINPNTARTKSDTARDEYHAHLRMIERFNKAAKG